MARMLIEDYAISYNVTTQFIHRKEAAVAYKKPTLVAMAPFHQQGIVFVYRFRLFLTGYLLPVRLEIKGLKGNIMLDESATKSRILKSFQSLRYPASLLRMRLWMYVSHPSRSLRSIPKTQLVPTAINST